jgi:hypothetical protein
MEQNTTIDLIFAKILDMISMVSETNGKVLAYLDMAEKKIPDKTLLEEVKLSIGRSNKSITELINDLQYKVDQKNNCPSCSDELKDDIKIIVDFVKIYTKGDYSPEDLSRLGQHIKDTNEMSDITKFAKKWGSVLLGVIFIFTTVIPNITKIIKFFTG